MKYTVEPGRNIYCDGRPFISIQPQGGTEPVVANSITHFVAMLLNEYGGAFARFHRQYMANPHRHRNYLCNPGLVVYGNPPRQLEIAEREIAGPFSLGGVISKRVEELAYTHLKDGKAYKHDFEEETWMAGVISKRGRRDVILFSPTGEPLWQDF